MNRPWDDCKFYLTSGCRNQHCKFRHSEQAKNAEITCNEWLTGNCIQLNCPNKHIQSANTVLCRFEFAPGGCRNAACTFQHKIQRQKEDSDLQKKLALFLAEHDANKSKDDSSASDKTQSVERKDSISSGSSVEVDLAALRAEALRTKVKNEKTIIKRKSNETPEVPNKKIKTGNANQLPNRKMGMTGIQINRKVNEDNNRRIISKREYSEDEVSDISLDELTDEEPEDLRATLNKSKNQIVRISNPSNPANPPNPDNLASRRLIRKVDPKQSPNKDRSRLITLRKNENSKSESRPSSSEWIERKISVKQSSKKGQINRLIAQVHRSSESDYSDAQSDESRDSSKNHMVKSKSRDLKRKPNMTWTNLTQNQNTEPSYNRKISYEENEVSFNRKITLKPGENQTGSSLPIKSRLNTTNVKSRLGHVTTNSGSEESVKKRLGVKNPNLNLESRLGVKNVKERLGVGKISERENNIPDQPKKKIISLKRKNQNSDISSSPVKTPKQPEVKPKTEKPAPEVKLNFTPAPKPKLEVKNQKPNSPISPRIRKSTKSSIELDLEDELLGEVDDDLILGNTDDIDDELFL